jgi:hypothetical protein
LSTKQFDSGFTERSVLTLPYAARNFTLSGEATFPRCSMYGIFTYICPKNQPNVGKYSTHGASGFGMFLNHHCFLKDGRIPTQTVPRCPEFPSSGIFHVS